MKKKMKITRWKECGSNIKQSIKKKMERIKMKNAKKNFKKK